MLLVYGKYHFGRTKVGVRNDYCNACEEECLAEQWRSFDCGHIYWIPLIPLGTHHRWYCAECRQDPRARYKTSFKSLKILGLVAVAILLLAFFLISPEGGDAAMILGMRIVLTLAFLGLLYWTFKGSSGGNLLNQDKRLALAPLSANVCVYCGGELANDAYLHCPACDVRIHT